MPLSRRMKTFRGDSPIGPFGVLKRVHLEANGVMASAHVGRKSRPAGGGLECHVGLAADAKNYLLVGIFLERDTFS